MELNLSHRNIFCAAETYYSSYEIIHRTLNMFNECTIFCSTSNPKFYILLRNIANFLNIPLVVSWPSVEFDLDSFLEPCGTMIFFTTETDAESNELMYTIIDDENSGFDQIIVCNDNGAGVYENNTG